MNSNQKPREWNAFECDESLFGHRNMNQERADFLGFKGRAFMVREVLSTDKTPDQVIEAAIEFLKTEIKKWNDTDFEGAHRLIECLEANKDRIMNEKT